MAEEALVESLITDSINLVTALDNLGNKPTKAFWYYYTDADEWRFIIAGATFDQLLPKEEARAYQHVAKAIASAGLASLTVANVKITRTDDTLLNTMRSLIGTPPDGIIRAHFQDVTFNGIFVKEMLILRSA